MDIPSHFPSVHLSPSPHNISSFVLDVPVAFPLSSSCVLAVALSLSFSLLGPGAMANHLLTNALLRPHGTNNPYNTLLGDSAVYNNPAVGMYNTQGVPDVSILNDTFPLNFCLHVICEIAFFLCI